MGFPSFSMILETVNLELAELDEVYQCLQSIADQDFKVSRANEVILVESGDIPKDRLEQLTSKYDWLTTFRVPDGIGYEEAKMAGLDKVSGDVVIFFDADCAYSSGWLRGMLEGLMDHPELGVLAGETMIRPDGVYGLAIASTFSLDVFSNKNDIYNVTNFHWNNVAFRREILSKFPIPVSLPMFRTSPRLYAEQLIEEGIRIGCQPMSQALHPPPNGFSHFFWRYLFFGHDALLNGRNRLGKSEFGPSLEHVSSPKQSFLSLGSTRISELFSRLYTLGHQESGRWIQLPAALIIALFGMSLMGAGYLLTWISPTLFTWIVPLRMKNRTGLA